MNRLLAATLAAFSLGVGATAACAAAARQLPSCDWDSPGHNPFMGDVVAAVDHYADIPADVRQRLQRRMAERRYDDMVLIRRDSIEGKHRYGSTIRQMHFGEASVCSRISRSGWTGEMRERGLVYCEGDHCILVPTVCRNVSRIDRLPPVRVAEPAPPSGTDPGGPGELLFEPPAAGAEPPGSFARLADPPDPGGGGMTPFSGPASSRAWPSGDYPPGWTDRQVGGGGPYVPTGGPGPFGLPPTLVGRPLVPVTPPGGGIDPPPIGGPAPPPIGVTPVPEPEAWALMAAGLALVAGVVRRRRRREAPAEG